MRLLLLLAAPIALAACSSGSGAGNNSAADQPVPTPTGPPPMTRKLDNVQTPANGDHWLKARPAPRDPQTAPYGNLLDAPVVNGATPTP